MRERHRATKALVGIARLPRRETRLARDPSAPFLVVMATGKMELANAVSPVATRPAHCYVRGIRGLRGLRAACFLLDNNNGPGGPCGPGVAEQVKCAVAGAVGLSEPCATLFAHTKPRKCRAGCADSRGESMRGGGLLLVQLVHAEWECTADSDSLLPSLSGMAGKDGSLGGSLSPQCPPPPSHMASVNHDRGAASRCACVFIAQGSKRN